MTDILLIGIIERTREGEITVDVCCRLPDWEEQTDEVLYRHIGAASHSLVYLGNFKQAGGTTQQDIYDPGGSWSALIINSFSK